MWDADARRMVPWEDLQGHSLPYLFSYGSFPVMQYTGLKDTEGHEIYEGDIVSFTYWWFDGSAVESRLTGEIVYLPDLMSYGLRGIKNADWIRHISGDEGVPDTEPFATFRFTEDEFLVLGNIYENPELMPSEEESNG